MNINTVDLNLFLVFRAIYVTRSVTQAGDSLNMTQSAVSNALKRLRERFDDPLFVRAPSGMQPTPMASDLINLIEEGLGKFTQAIDQARRFEPALSDRRFRLAINDIGQFVLMPGLLVAVHDVAPEVRFETVGASSAEEARNLLLEGKVDVAIGSWPLFGQRFCHTKMCEESFAVLLGAGHEINTDTLTISEYLEAEHLTYRPSGASDAALQQTLAAHGMLAQRKVVLTAAHSLGLERVVASTKLLLTVPLWLARAMVESNPGLRLARLPFPATPIEIWMQWHERFDSDSGNRWLRSVTHAVFRSLPALDVGK